MMNTGVYSKRYIRIIWRYNMKKILIVFLAVTTLICGAADKKKIVRVVSVSPNMTEIICALGQEKSLIGRSDVCDYPASVKNVPIVGKFGRPNFERVIASKPDYIVSSAMQDKALIKRFQDFKIKVLFLPAKNFDDYLKSLKIMGKILNCPKKAAKLIDTTQKELKKLKREAAEIPEKEKVKAFIVIQGIPLITVGNKSFINDMVKLAGGINVSGTQNKSYFHCSIEWLLGNQPDVLIMPGISETRLKALINSPGWKSFKAVKQGRYYYKLNTSEFFRMGPRTIKGVKALKTIFQSVKGHEKK